MKHSHYHRDVSHLKTIDVYRVIELFNVTDPCAQHALKKLLCAGLRGVKTEEQDIREAYDTLSRRLQMFAEDDNALVSHRPQPTQDNDWIEWHGGQCPVGDVLVDVQLSSGQTYRSASPYFFNWEHGGYSGDIIAYRISQEAAR